MLAILLDRVTLISRFFFVSRNLQNQRVAKISCYKVHKDVKVFPTINLWFLFTINPGGRANQQKFYTGRLRLQVEPISFLYTIFNRKKYPFRTLSTGKLSPFHISTNSKSVSHKVRHLEVFQLKVVLNT